MELDTSINNNNDDNANASVSKYLITLLKYITILSSTDENNNNVTSATVEEEEEDAEKLLDMVAKALLNACDPQIMSLELPFPFSRNDYWTKKRREEEEEEEEAPHSSLSSPPPSSAIQRMKRRVDLLRYILRASSPIALHVSIVLSHALIRIFTSSREEDKKRKEEASAKAFVLFGTWLPIAPQIAPIVSDLFGWKDFACPFHYRSIVSNENDAESTTGMDIDTEEEEDDERKTDCMLVLAEAANSLCTFYYNRGGWHGHGGG
eukprot:15329331-Ditylum_brightwellii.AAC.1